ncbi:MAG: DUF3467 domain-containing protein [Acidobacteriota bacterium]|nr:DUF3467 domain-containing protein [Acidobacteriota bacterium]
MGNEKKELKVRIPESIQSGVYSNNAVVAHTREEFIVDFLMTAPPSGSVVSRVILSPGHVKRLVNTLQANLKKYEQSYGPVTPMEIPPVNMGYSG